MNTEVMFSSKTVEWYTPQPLFDKLNEMAKMQKLPKLQPTSEHKKYSKAMQNNRLDICRRSYMSFR
jgi:hypothetical protein